MLQAQDIATALAAQDVPPTNVAANWPIVYQALRGAGIADRATQIATAATIVVETGVTIDGVNRAFTPIPELGDEAYFRNELGNDWQYHGRGYVQITWSSNYAHYGSELGIDLLHNPDLALQPDVAAKILALYFHEHGIPALAAASDWQGVRRAVNGGENGLPVFLAAVTALSGLQNVPDAPPVTKVMVAGALKTAPDHASPVAIDAQRKPVMLTIGTVVRFSPDPHTGQQTTPDWAHINLASGPIHGWYPRASLETIGA
jgi:hypothetical protein